MLLSVIVPVYRVEDYLPGCVASILANDTASCEIILVDDGSDDGCGKLCDDYAAARPDLIRVIHQENGGLGAARNTGIAAAKGDWLLFVDSDDKLTSDALAVLKQAAREGDAEIYAFGFRADNGSDPPTPQPNLWQGRGPFRLADAPDYLLELPSAWMRLWRRSLFVENGITYPSRVWYEDIRTTTKLLALASGIRVLPEHLYDYLSRPGSIMNSAKLSRNREILDAMDDILSWYRAEGLYDQYEAELCALTVQHVLLAASVRVARADPASPLLAEFAAYTQEHFPRWRENRYLPRLPRLKRLALKLVEGRHYRLLRLLFRLKG